MLRRLWQSSFVRFLFVGVLNTLIGLSSILIIFNVVGIGYWLSTFLGNTIGGVTSYFLNRRITFRSNTSFKRSWWKFMLVVLLCYALSYSIGLWIDFRQIYRDIKYYKIQKRNYKRQVNNIL